MLNSCYAGSIVTAPMESRGDNPRVGLLLRRG